MTANSKVLSKKQKNSSNNTHLPANELAQIAIEAAFSKKATDLVVMDMRAISSIADFFVLCTGTSELQIKAIKDAIRASIKEQASELPWHMEGHTNNQWVLMDYVDMVVHIFNEEKRAYYDLERLWGDAPKESINEDDLLESIAILGGNLNSSDS